MNSRGLRSGIPFHEELVGRQKELISGIELWRKYKGIEKLVEIYTHTVNSSRSNKTEAQPPFTAQKFAIKSALLKAGISTSGLTIGTVHALQSTERPIILFSTVYGLNNLGNSFFLDQGVNILNIAVSQAKDCFFLFGCPDIFPRNSNTPSSKLHRHIQETTTVQKL